jgi:hypothetical protein
MESVKISLASKIKNLILETQIGELKENYMMRNLVVVAVLMLCFSALTVAQELPKFEIFGGWSYLRPDGGSTAFAQGWNASVTTNINDWLGFTIGGSGHYADDERLHTLLLGPKFTLRQNEKYTPFWHAMVGLTHASWDVLPTESWVIDDFVMLFGGGLDVKVNKRFSVRAFQADYQLERAYGDFTPYLTFSAGVVVKIGER